MRTVRKADITINRTRKEMPERFEILYDGEKVHPVRLLKTIASVRAEISFKMSSGQYKRDLFEIVKL